MSIFYTVLAVLYAVAAIVALFFGSAELSIGLWAFSLAASAHAKYESRK